MVTSQVSLEWTKYKALLEGYLSQGLTIVEMGKLEGVTKQSISRRLKKYGLKPNRVRKSLSKQKKVTQVTNKTLHSQPPHKQQPGASPGTSSKIPDDIKKIGDYMDYFAQKGLTVKFNEVLTYLDKTKQLNEQGGSELASQMTVNQLLAVIKPNESLLPDTSPSQSSFKDSISLTNLPKPK